MHRSTVLSEFSTSYSSDKDQETIRRNCERSQNRVRSITLLKMQKFRSVLKSAMRIKKEIEEQINNDLIKTSRHRVQAMKLKSQLNQTISDTGASAHFKKKMTMNVNKVKKSRNKAGKQISLKRYFDVQNQINLKTKNALFSLERKVDLLSQLLHK